MPSGEVAEPRLKSRFVRGKAHLHHHRPHEKTRVGALVLRFKPYYYDLLYKTEEGTKFSGFQMLMPSLLSVYLSH